jgi:lipoyl-dependent peroxiredoxin subunit D
MIATQNETLARMLADFKLEEDFMSKGLTQLAEADHRYVKDMRINLTNALSYPNLNKKESYLLALAVAVNEKNTPLIDSFTKLAETEMVTQEELNEVYACVSLMNVNNVFYRFRHFTKKDYYQQTPAGIKMSIMLNPVLGKEFFELLSLAISAVNGCELCVSAHEQSVMQHGATEARVYDAIRLVSIVKGFSNLF